MKTRVTSQQWPAVVTVACCEASRALWRLGACAPVGISDAVLRDVSILEHEVPEALYEHRALHLQCVIPVKQVT